MWLMGKRMWMMMLMMNLLGQICRCLIYMQTVAPNYSILPGSRSSSAPELLAKFTG
jgi:hypothetical protein